MVAEATNEILAKGWSQVGEDDPLLYVATVKDRAHGKPSP
jgi:hypothetical protein